MRIFDNMDVNFLGKRRTGYIFSMILLGVAIVGLIYPGLEAGIDFKGGTEFVVQTAEPIAPSQARAPLAAAFPSGAEVKEYGDPRTLLVRTAQGGSPDTLQAAVVGAFARTFAGSNPQILRVDSVGPRVASDLKSKAILLVLFSLAVILAYIFVRFDWRFAVGAVLCLLHDVIVVLGVFALFHRFTPFSLQVDQAIIAALLTIVGYSINDTVVVYDRIREYTSLFKTRPFAEVANQAINTTLSRTILTSGTTLISVLVLFLFGGETLRGFSLALLIGITLGTYSSIFVASPLVVELRERYAPAKRR